MHIVMLILFIVRKRHPILSLWAQRVNESWETKKRREGQLVLGMEQQERKKELLNSALTMTKHNFEDDAVDVKFRIKWPQCCSKDFRE